MPDLYYRRNLPHYQPAEATFFVTFRLAGSIPVDKLRRMKENYALLKRNILSKHDLSDKERKELIYLEQKRQFAETDSLLDFSLNGPYWLRENEIADIIANEMHLHNTQWYTIWAYCIMPNHVHVLMTLKKDAPTLTKIMQNIKSYSAIKSNRVLHREGQFWERESYDHFVRNKAEFYRIAKYIMNNPVKAKFVKNWMDWPYTYLHPALQNLT